MADLDQLSRPNHGDRGGDVRDRAETGLAQTHSQTAREAVVSQD